jgi:hypothetical protein
MGISSTTFWNVRVTSLKELMFVVLELIRQNNTLTALLKIFLKHWVKIELVVMRTNVQSIKFAFSIKK